jgi:hypothetical protein
MRSLAAGLAMVSILLLSSAAQAQRYYPPGTVFVCWVAAQWQQCRSKPWCDNVNARPPGASCSCPSTCRTGPTRVPGRVGPL